MVKRTSFVRLEINRIMRHPLFASTDNWTWRKSGTYHRPNYNHPLHVVRKLCKLTLIILPMAAREFLAPGGIDHFVAPPISSPSVPLEVGTLKEGLLNPAMESGERCKLPSEIWNEAQPPTISVSLCILRT